MISVCEGGAFMLSNHAATRMAQRGIQSAILDLVLLHGTRAKAQRDCEEYVLSVRSARHLEAAGYDNQTITSAKKVRAIVDTEGMIVTCYHRRNSRPRQSSREPHFHDPRHH